MDKDQGLGPNVLLVGALGIIVACATSVHYAHVVKSDDMSADWFPYAAGIAFLIVLFGINPLLRVVNRRLELNRAELLLIFSMIFIATPLATKGFASSFLAHLLGPMFYSDQSNQYWIKLGQHLPAWLYPDDKRAILWFWEGLPVGESIPWGAWMSPLLYWAVIFGAIYGLITSMVVIMRKQWVENERLIFPLMEAPMALLEDYEKGRRIPPMMRTPLFWIGAGLVIVIYGTHILNHLNPVFPSIRLLGVRVMNLNFSDKWSELPLHLFPSVLAFGFLIKRDILLSVWLFGFLVYLQYNLLVTLGYSAGPAIRYEDHFNPALAWQCLGALVVFVVVGLYMARRHLRDVARKMVTGAPDVDDSRELMGYRPAGIVFILSFLTLFAVMIRMGMTPGVAATMIGTLIIFNLAVTRFVIEGGLLLFHPPASALAEVIGLFGAKGMPIASMGAIAACAPISNDFRTGVMPAMANSAKLFEGARMRRGTLLKAMVFALVLGTVVSLLVTALILYDIGATNSQEFHTKFHGFRYFQSLVGTLDSVAQPSGVRMGWAGVGAVVMAVLTLGRYNFAWWPLHPIGFPVAMPIVVWGFQPSMFSIFVAWVAKSIILRLGGVPLYNRAKPFFIGLLIGHLVIVAIGYLVDLVVSQPPGVNLVV